MKRTLFTLASICAVLLIGCSDDNNTPNPDGGKPDMPVTAPESGTPDGPADDDGAAAEGTASPDGAQGDAPKGNFQVEVQPLFTSSCATASCHGGAAPKAGLSLEDGKSIANLVGVQSVQCASLKRVEANKPHQSYLMQKLEGTGSCFTMQKMPVGSTLNTAQIAAIHFWISGGAKP